MCHRRLAEDRPGPSRLTEFYLMIAIGGVVGGLFNALAAPAIFEHVLEYPIALGAACLLRPQLRDDLAARRPAWVEPALATLTGAVLLGLMVVVERAARADALLTTWPGSILANGLGSDAAAALLTAWAPVALCLLAWMRRGSLRFATGASVLLIGAYFTGVAGTLLLQERTFFGVHRVVSDRRGLWHSLSHGTTLHGLQGRFEEMRRGPTSYYHPTGPIGDVIIMLQAAGRFRHAGIVGMGAGTLAAYGRKGDALDFFELDPAVVRIADDPAYFTYIADARAAGVAINTHPGDGRLRLASPEIEDGRYDLLVIDAFSSDAIPVHLLTLEAVELYRRKLAPGGILAFHVSNRFFELRPVLARIARELGMAAWHRSDSTVSDRERDQGKKESVWVVLAASDTDVRALATGPRAWVRWGADGGRLWTDEYSNPLGALKRRAPASR